MDVNSLKFSCSFVDIIPYKLRNTPTKNVKNFAKLTRLQMEIKVRGDTEINFHLNP